jgi:hypothetical protein
MMAVQDRLNYQETFSQPGDVYYELGPNFSNQERLVTQALMTATIPGQVLQAQVRPNIPGIDPFPPRWGYLPYQYRQSGIEQVLDVPRTYRNRRDDLSGGVAGMQSAARNVQSDVW